ncbi:MarR family winged helix-turn-helix transcriptional regulator, partial [Candidatus Cloacimonadota bacterium]
IILWDISKEISLSPIQIQFIYYINGKKHRASTVSEIASEFDLKKATVTESINNLVKKGVIVKLRSDQDKRVFFLNLTDKSESILASINKRKSMFISNISELDKDIKVKTYSSLTKLLEKFFQDQLIQKAVMCPTCLNYKELDGLGDSYICDNSNSERSLTDIKWNCENYVPVTK